MVLFQGHKCSFTIGMGELWIWRLYWSYKLQIQKNAEAYSGRNQKKLFFWGEEPMKWLPPILAKDFFQQAINGGNSPAPQKNGDLGQFAVNCGELRWIAQIGDYLWCCRVCYYVGISLKPEKLQQIGDNLRWIAVNCGILLQFVTRDSIYGLKLFRPLFCDPGENNCRLKWGNGPHSPPKSILLWFLPAHACVE